MSIGTANPAHPAVALRHRINVEQLSPSQLGHVRQAFAASQAIADDRGYERWAGIHGLPLPMYCTHGSPLFLPWHRAYLYSFELSLRDASPGITGFALPWWDWTSPGSHARGIPEAYAAATDDSGDPNPLFSAAVDPRAIKQDLAQGDRVGPRTVRRPGPPSELPSTADVRQALAASDFLDFSGLVEDIHNNVHSWVGGHMGEIPVAAFDPLFWAHHCMIDRLWRIWQLQHLGSAVPASLMGQALAPFPMTVAQTIDATSLGYDYAATVSLAKPQLVSAGGAAARLVPPIPTPPAPNPPSTPTRHGQP
ncbi:MAG: tyrosinase [Solirubrobacteraceae bacterium]|jgi:tyrosinase|nr:tyrosinase [Solirubrobacteraceae bacterium]